MTAKVLRRILRITRAEELSGIGVDGTMIRKYTEETTEDVGQGQGMLLTGAVRGADHEIGMSPGQEADVIEMVVTSGTGRIGSEARAESGIGQEEVRCNVYI